MQAPGDLLGGEGKGGHGRKWLSGDFETGSWRGVGLRQRGSRLLTWAEGRALGLVDPGSGTHIPQGGGRVCSSFPILRWPTGKVKVETAERGVGGKQPPRLHTRYSRPGSRLEEKLRSPSPSLPSRGQSILRLPTFFDLVFFSDHLNPIKPFLPASNSSFQRRPMT